MINVFLPWVKRSLLAVVFGLLNLLLRVGLVNKRLIKYKLSIGIALLLMKGAMTVSAQDMNVFRRATCYRWSGGRLPWEGRQSTIGVSTGYKNGITQFDVRAGHLFKSVYVGIDFKFRTTQSSHTGIYPGMYVRFAPYYFGNRRRMFAIVTEANYHFSDQVFRKSTAPMAQDLGLMVGVSTIFGVGSYLCFGLELAAENEIVFYNNTETTYVYPVVRVSYYFKVHGKKKE
jgi:hypothetical protein